MRNLDFLDAAHEVTGFGAWRVYLGLAADRSMLEVLVGPQPASLPSWPLAHARLSSVLESWVRGDELVVVSECVRGPTLEELVAATERTGRGLPLSVIARMITDLAEGLAQVQRSGRPHGALALHSARVDASGRTRIVDVPRAWLAAPGRPSDTPASFDGDVFALGTVGARLTNNCVERSSPLLSSLPAALARAVCDDPPSISEFARALERAAGGASYADVAKGIAAVVVGADPSARRSVVLRMLEHAPGSSDVGFDDLGKTEPLQATGAGRPFLIAGTFGHAVAGDFAQSSHDVTDDVATDGDSGRGEPPVEATGTELLGGPTAEIATVRAATTDEISGRSGEPSTKLDRSAGKPALLLLDGELSPGVMLGRYRIDALIGRGGLAEVYRATMKGPLGFEKVVAIKRIKPKYANDTTVAQMIIDEARITKLVSHPNIAQVFELGDEGQQLFLVMELVDGEPLSGLLSRAVGPVLGAYIVSEMLLGLHAAHVQRFPSGDPARIVHRDVSPANVLLTRDGRVKVIDFGIARAVGRLEETQAGVIKGKLRYLAPEVVARRRFGAIDHRVDIFAAGVVLWELVAGRRLFERDAPDVVMRAIAEMPLPDLHAEGLCDEVLGRALARALARHVEDRWASADAFAQELRRWLLARDPGFTAAHLAAFLRRAAPSPVS